MSPQTLDLIAAVQRAVKESGIDMTKAAPERLPRDRVLGEVDKHQVEASGSEATVSPRGDDVNWERWEAP